MRKFIFVSLLLLLSAPVFSAQQTLNNLETFGVQRAKINENFTELYSWGNHGLVGYLENSSDVIGVFTGTADGTKFLRDDGTLAVPAGSGHTDGSNCAAGFYPLGVDASGAAQSCTDATTEIDAAIAAAASNYATAAQGTTADAALQPADVEDTPENGSGDPISSNWAFDHGAAADPHTGYMLESNIGSGASNYLQLSATPGTPDGTKYLRDDRTWQVVSAGHGDGTNCAAGSYPLGVDGDGNTQGCTDATTEIDSAIAAAASSYATAAQGATADTAVQPGDAGTVFLAPTGDGSGLSGVVTSETDPTVGTAGVLASVITVGDPGSDSNVPTEQAVREAFDAHAAASGAHNYTDLDFTGTTGLSDGVDNTGLPSQIILYSGSGTPAAFDTACVEGVLAYIDEDENFSGVTADYECSIQFLNGSQWTSTTQDNDLTFTGKLIGPADETIFPGFTEGEITIGPSTDTIYGQWFDIITGDSLDDSDGFDAFFGSLTGYQTATLPVDAAFNNSTRVGWDVPGIRFYANGSTLTPDADSTGGLNLIGALDNCANTSDGSCVSNVSISVTADDNTFTVPGTVTVSVGDYIHIYDDDNWTDADQGYAHGWLGEVVGISGSTATMSVAANFSYTAENIYIYNPVSRFLIDGLTVDMSGQTTTGFTSAISAIWSEGGIIQNSKAVGSDDAHAGVVVRGTNNIIRQTYSSGFWEDQGFGGGRGGYAYEISGIGNVLDTVSGGDSKHIFTTGGRNYHSGKVTIINSDFYNSDKAATTISGGDFDGVSYGLQPIDTHTNTLDISLVNTKINTPSDLMFGLRGETATIVNNTLVQRDAGQANDDWFIEVGAYNNPKPMVFSGNKITTEDAGETLCQGKACELLVGSDNVFQGTMTGENGESLESGLVGNNRLIYNNIVDTTTFESDLESWAITAGTGDEDARQGRSTTMPFEGAYSVGIFGWATSGTGTLSKTFALEAGVTYEVGIWVFGSSTTAGEVNAHLYTESGTISNTVLNDQNWRYISGTFTSDGSTVVGIANTFYATYGEGFWVDNITLRKAPVQNSLLVYEDNSFVPSGDFITIDNASKGILLETLSNGGDRGFTTDMHFVGGGAPLIRARRSRSTDNTPGASDQPVAGDGLINTFGYGWDGDSWEVGGGYRIMVENTFSASDNTSYFDVYLKDGTTWGQRFKVSGDGTVTIPGLVNCSSGICTDGSGVLSCCP